MIKSQARFYIHRNNSLTELQSIVQEAKKLNLVVKLNFLDSELEEIKKKIRKQFSMVFLFQYMIM
ncbi:hypothetical protein CPJCM30710_27730 [Clostridium polyendosporum]|uniref:Uncharacterized protein n=1 Tax=Clostridium polyendosporum TaxID=69208 RepID=A0A919VHC4_9CLOT|nr:hypothetical protein CPJCM30710_27730 [Clostridium polyendosporum]